MSSVAARKRIKPLDLGLFGEMPLAVVAFLVWRTATGTRGFSYDFVVFRTAGEAVIHGRTPYVEPTVRLLSHNDRYVYPQPFAFLFAPFNLIGVNAGAVVFLALSMVALFVALRVLGVRDWRCFGAAAVSSSTLSALGLGTVGPLLVLGIAVAWRYRDEPVTGVALALVAAMKLFLWPVLVWLVVTRRVKATVAAAATLLGLVGVWAALDWHGLREYPETIRVLDRIQSWRSYSPESLVRSFGGTTSQGHLVVLALAVVGVAAMWTWRRDEQRSLALACITALVGTPILWLHYLVLLLVPLALYQPSLGWLWASPVLLWATIRPQTQGDLWRIVLGLAVIAIVSVVVLRREEGQTRVRREASVAGCFIRGVSRDSPAS